MRKKLWIGLALTLIVPGLLLNVSCARKPAKPDAKGTQVTKSTQTGQTAKTQTGEQQTGDSAQRIAEEKLRMFLNEHIYFAFDSAVLTPTAQQVLQRKAAWMGDNPAASVTVEGHCDERGTNEYNLALGDRRAQSAMKYLLELGVPAAHLKAVSYGEERPLDLSQNEEAWAKNRRAQFVTD